MEGASRPSLRGVEILVAGLCSGERHLGVRSCFCRVGLCQLFLSEVALGVAWDKRGMAAFANKSKKSIANLQFNNSWSAYSIVFNIQGMSMRNGKDSSLYRDT